MTIKEKTVYLTSEDIRAAHLSEARKAELEMALQASGYRLVIEPSQARK